MDNLSPQEQARRKDIAAHARRLLLDNLVVQDADETSLLLHHEGFFLHISFSCLHPLMVIQLACGLGEKIGTAKQKTLINELNLKSVLGCHAINGQMGCYTYRAAHWLETEITLPRFHEILGRCTEEAQRGHALLSA